MRRKIHPAVSAVAAGAAAALLLSGNSRCGGPESAPGGTPKPVSAEAQAQTFLRETAQRLGAQAIAQLRAGNVVLSLGATLQGGAVPGEVQAVSTCNDHTTSYTSSFSFRTGTPLNIENPDTLVSQLTVNESDTTGQAGGLLSGIA